MNQRNKKSNRNKNQINGINKKGMGVGQVFIYIISALTFALIMIFGYKAIIGFLNSSEQVQFVEFKNNLESSVKKIYSEYGAVREETFSLPRSYEKICFVDMDSSPKPGEMDALCKESSAACTIWEEAQIANSERKKGWEMVNENVFLTPIASSPIKVFRITISDVTGNIKKGFWCVPLDENSFSIVLEGKGDHTEISPSE